MASYKNSHKNTKMKSKFYSDVSSRRSSEKPKKDKTITLTTKVVVRRLPPSMTEELFVECVSPLPEHDYFAFINADSSLGSSAYSRAYINFKCVDDVYTFRDKFDGYVFVDQKGNEHPAMVEYAPFQKIPKRTGGKKKDARCGTIDEDVDYTTFLENLNKPITITLPPLEAVLEEIQAQDRELKANNGLIKVKTPLLEYIEQRKAEKLRSKEEKKEERRRKEFERKKAREEERKKKKEVRDLHREKREKEREERDKEKREEKEHHRDFKKEQKDDSSVKVLRPERGKEEYSSDVRQEKSRSDREKERQKREEERLKQRREKEKLRREKEKEERLRRLEDKSKMREEEKFKPKEEPVEDWQEEKVLPVGKPEVSKSKRYSEGRRKEREKERFKEDKSREKKYQEEQEELDENTDEGNGLLDKEQEREEIESFKKEDRGEERVVTSRKRRDKDPRVERRIRNKDRPAMALYRPGQSRLSSRMRQDREEGAETSSSSPSPVMPAGEQKKSPSQSKKDDTDSSRSDCKEDCIKMEGDSADSAEAEAKEVPQDEDEEVKDDESEDLKVTRKATNTELFEEESSARSKEGKDKQGEKKQETEDDIDVRDGAYSTEGLQGKQGDGVDSISKDVKKYPGVKSMTFRRSVSRE